MGPLRDCISVVLVLKYCNLSYDVMIEFHVCLKCRLIVCFSSIVFLHLLMHRISCKRSLVAAESSGT